MGARRRGSGRVKRQQEARNVMARKVQNGETRTQNVRNSRGRVDKDYHKYSAARGLNGKDRTRSLGKWCEKPCERAQIGAN